MRKSIVLLIFVLLFTSLSLTLISVPASGAEIPAKTDAITISGTVTGPGGIPVENVYVEAWSSTGDGNALTNNNGYYEFLVSSGEIVMRVKPPEDLRLAERYIHMGYRNTSFTQNFDVVAGHLISGTVQLPDGSPPDSWQWVEFNPVSFSLPVDEWLGASAMPGSGVFQAVIPAGIYRVRVTPPSPYYLTILPIDLTFEDVTGIVLTYNTELPPPFPYDPPNASKITIGQPDNLGEATVTGVPGAVLPLAHVLLVNLNSAHQSHTISGVDGRFTARIYAPPGSAIMVKHGPGSGRWNDLEIGISEGVNPYPGTIIHVLPTHEDLPEDQPFAAVGAVMAFYDDINTTPNYVGAAWAITGTLSPVVVEGEWERLLNGIYEGEMIPGLYLGGLNWTHPALADLDADGDLDLLVGERSGTIVLFRNLGTPAIPDWQFESADFAGIDTDDWAYPALADVTGDNAPDLFVGIGNGSLEIYYNVGTPGEPAWPPRPDVLLTAGTYATPALNDLDGDGDLDILAGHVSGTLYYYKNTGSLTNPVWSLVTGSYSGINEGSHIQPAFIDLDGDTDRDLILGLQGQLIWFRRDCTPANPLWTRQSNDPIGYGGGSSATSPSVGDWNHDGLEDLVVGEHWGALRFFQGEPGLSWTEQSYSFPFELAGDTAPSFADWDADGDLDLLIGQAHGQVHQYTNIGSTAEPNWRYDGVLLNLPWTDHPHAFPALVDVDGDDDYDLFIGEGGYQGTGAGGSIHYYRNDGTPTTPNWILVTDTFLGLDVGGWSTPSFIDIDSDGDMDLFIGDEAGTLTFVENTGSPTAPAWAVPVQPYAGLSLGAYSAPSFFDVDEDGDLDILVGQGDGSLAYVRNTGNVYAPSWEVVVVRYPGITAGEHAMPTEADADGDGIPELFLGTGDGGLRLYRYLGPGSVEKEAVYASGDLFKIKTRLQLFSQAITLTTDLDGIQVNGELSLMMQHNAAGQPIAAENYFMSTLFTPGGFPIQRSGQPAEGLNININIANLVHQGNHAVAGDFTITGEIPDDLPAGIYRPMITFGFTGVPTSTQWLAANVTFHGVYSNQAVLPPVQIGQVNQPHLIWRLLNDDPVQGTRGTGARQDEGVFGLSSQIVTQGALNIIPPMDERTGKPIVYRLEPFLPMISFTDRRMPNPPLIPFELPGGQIQVMIQQPDGTVVDLGSDVFVQSFNRTKTTRAGADLNGGTIQMEDVYSLITDGDQFRITFNQYGHHVITMTGTTVDIWGNTYSGGGTYDVWVAFPLDIDPGVLPGTPLAVGDSFNPTLQFYPRLPAEVDLILTVYPNSDREKAITYAVSGQANPYGYFSSEATPIVVTQPGEYRLDLTAKYTSPSGIMHMGSMTWGGVIMTPPNQTQLVAHGRRGLDSLIYIPNHWFVARRDLTIPPKAISHTFNPYYNGDILWTRATDNAYGGDSLVIVSSVQDTVGAIEAAILGRAARMQLGFIGPGDLNERTSRGELPLFSSTYSGRQPQLAPEDMDQIAYSYRSSQRPGLRVREVVSEDGITGGYWRLDTLYDDQLGVGILGDLPIDYKFQYLGVVYRDLQTGHNEYLGQGTGWVFIPDEDPVGSRAMPPFAGPGNGGWTTEGGPILTLKGEEVHMFILPTGVQPGAILEVGEVFHFAGHLMPTLDSQVAFTVTSPSGAQHTGGGQANSIGYFYEPDESFVVNEPGLWSVDVHVWHDGQCSGGATIPPYPSGDVLGSEDGRYWFYVVPAGAERLNVTTPTAGYLSFGEEVTPITITGTVPGDLNNVMIDYTIRMPGFILQHGQITPTGDIYELVFDPVTLQEDFPNLDLIGRDEYRAGLADTISIDLLMRGQRGGQAVYQANTVTLQGQQVYVETRILADLRVYLPVITR